MALHVRGDVAPPSAGSLEELDGTPIGPAVPPRATWPADVRLAVSLAGSRPAVWAYSLLGFLARGGLILLLAPMVALPTFVNLANLVGPTSVTPAGPTARLVTLIVVVTLIVAAAIVAGVLIGAAAEMAAYRATIAPAPDDAGWWLPPTVSPVASGSGTWRTVARVAVVRLVTLAPVVLALAWGVPEYVTVAYRELVQPLDLVTPLPIRVLLATPVPSILLLVAWLAGEIVGGFAARRVVIFGSGSARGIGSGVMDVVRAPVRTVLSVLVALGASAIAFVPVLLLEGLAWDEARIALVDGREPVLVLGTTLLLAAAWCLALLVAAIAAAFRSTLLTVHVVRRASRR
jgi:hypothetical protein